MKNFRKVLALILVVATLFSFTAMASAKTTGDYKDGDKVTYTEAVDVLSTIGILEGYPDGSFGPAKNITRAEMAKMIAVLSNAGSDISSLYASACTFADSKNSWAASYIAYCNQTGIVAGRSATTFDPNANVTGIETAKMLLVTLGFDAKEQGYVGTNWKTNVLRDAKNFGLLDGFAASYDIAKAITREEAAQMFLNTLCAPIVVGTVSSNIVKISNALYADLKNVKITLIDASTYGWVLSYGNVMVSTSPLASIYKGLDLAFAQDCYGRPGYNWTYTDPSTKKTTKIGFYRDAARKSYTTVADIGSDFKDLLNASHYEFYVDGVLVDSHGIANTNAQAVAAKAAQFTGNGVETDVYVVNVENTVTKEYEEMVIVTAVWTYIAKVSATSDYYGTFTVDYDGGSATFAQTANKVATGDYVLLHVCKPGANLTRVHGQNTATAATGALVGYDLHDVTVVKPVTAQVTYGRNTSDINTSYFKADKTYNYNVNFGRLLTGTAWNQTMNDILTAANGSNGLNADIYLDAYGYVMYVAKHNSDPAVQVAFFEEDSGKEVSNGFVWVDGVRTETFTQTASAAVYGDKDGAVTLETINVNRDLLDRLGNRTAHESVGLLTKYTVAANGTFTVKAHADFAPEGAKLSKTSRVILADKLYADSDTKFMIRSTDPKTGDWTYELITGYQNLKETYIAEHVNSTAYPNATSIQYFVSAAEPKMAEYVFIDAVYTTSSDEFFVMGVEYSAFWKEIAGVYAADYLAYRALVNGEDSIVLMDLALSNKGGVELLVPGNMYQGGLTYRGVTMDEDGTNLPLYVVANDKVPNATTTAQVAKAEIYVDSKGDVQVRLYKKDAPNDYTIAKGADEVKVFHIRAASEAENEYKGYWVETNKISGELQVEATKMYVVYDGNGNVTALYLYETDLTPAP